MYLYIKQAKNRVQGFVVGGDELKAFRKASGLSIAQTAGVLGLASRSALLQYESGSKPVSKALSKRYLALAQRTVLEAIVMLEPADVYGSPAYGLPVGIEIHGEIARCPCGCGKHFLQNHKSRRYASRKCQVRAWHTRALLRDTDLRRGVRQSLGTPAGVPRRENRRERDGA